jgi:hypothetical protein
MCHVLTLKSVLFCYKALCARRIWAIDHTTWCGQMGGKTDVRTRIFAVMLPFYEPCAPELIPFAKRLCILVVRVSGYRSRGFGFDSLHYQIFCEVLGLERGPLSLVSKLEEYLEEKVAIWTIEQKILSYCLRDPLRWPRDTLYPQRLALTSLTIGGRLVGRVLSRTKATELLLLLLLLKVTLQNLVHTLLRQCC